MTVKLTMTLKLDENDYKSDRMNAIFEALESIGEFKVQSEKTCDGRGGRIKALEGEVEEIISVLNVMAETQVSNVKETERLFQLVSDNFKVIAKRVGMFYADFSIEPPPIVAECVPLEEANAYRNNSKSALERAERAEAELAEVSEKTE